MLNKNELLNNLIWLGQLRDHRTARMLDPSAEFVNEINKITVKILDDKQAQIQYNVYNQSVINTVPSNLIYEFLDDLFQRNEQVQITLKNGTIIEPNDWRDQLKPGLL